MNSQNANNRKNTRIYTTMSAALLCAASFILAGCATWDSNQAIYSTNTMAALSAIEKITDQTILFKVAIEAIDGQVAAAAAEKLVSQALLIKVVNEARNSMSQVTALKKITNQSALANIAISNWPLRVAAVESITDQSLLAKVAKETDDGADHISIIVMGKLTNQAVLSEMAMEDNEGWSEIVRLAAVAKLTNQFLLAKIARNTDKAWALRATALANINNQDLTTDPELSIKHSAEIRKLREFLENPAIIDHIGTCSVMITQDSLQQGYGQGNFVFQKLNGEVISVFVMAERLKEDIGRKWKTDFPSETSASGMFLPAQIEIGYLMKDVLIEGRFSRSALKSVINNSADEYIRSAAQDAYNEVYAIQK